MVAIVLIGSGEFSRALEAVVPYVSLRDVCVKCNKINAVIV